MPFHPSQLFASGSQYSAEATLLSNAFNTTTLQDLASGNGNMDTGASSHLNDFVHCLSDILNMCIYPSVVVGDGCFIPVTNSGHSVLSPLFHPLLKDFITRRVLLRCDRTGDLYSFTKPSTIPHAFLTSQYTWNQRLGHPGSEVLRRLVSSDSISCNKEKLPVLCHTCQLGKNVKLPFVSSSSSITLCFDIVHSDLWTSLILSLFGFQYYVLFLDHYSHLSVKSSVFSVIMLSELMIRTINNLICTLLIKAHLPPNHWTETLNMAIYLLNILPSRAINNEIPFTHLFGVQPDYSILRVFRCLCYPHIDTNHKLRPPATPSIYLGHAANHFGYRCLDLNTNKIIVSHHVTFHETVFPFPSNKSTTTPSYDSLNDSTDLISIIIHTAPITPVPTLVHTPQVDVPTPPTPPIPPTPPPPPTPQSTHPNPHYAGHVSTISPLPRSYKEAFNDPNWQNAMFDEYNARSLYGLKQAPRAWFQWFAAYITTVGFTPSRCISVTHDSSSMFISQCKYALESLERAHMVGCNPSRTHVDTESKLGDGGTSVVDPTLYWSLAGSLRYLTFTRPDIMYAVQQVFLYMHDLWEPYFTTLKRIL
nr:ribonuclease H-like domain-containing protein [Tanacetum cinerariifolium]